MEVKNNKIESYSKILDETYGAEGTPEREAFRQKAVAYYTGRLLEEARKEANLTQEELAQKIGANKSYISRIENGKTDPKVSTFYKIVEALGLEIDLVPAV